jgi:hypothetical protein
MEEIVASERSLGRMLALLPAVVVGVCVRLLTLGSTPLALRLVAAALVAAACWSAYRLLTARIVVDAEGIHVRGVLYDADLPWTQVRSASVVPAARPLRAMVWGVMQPHTLELHTTSATRLRPVVTLGPSDDHELRLVMGAIRAYLSSVNVPMQRQPEASTSTV